MRLYSPKGKESCSSDKPYSGLWLRPCVYALGGHQAPVRVRMASAISRKKTSGVEIQRANYQARQAKLILLKENKTRSRGFKQRTRLQHNPKMTRHTNMSDTRPHSAEGQSTETSATSPRGEFVADEDITHVTTTAEVIRMG